MATQHCALCGVPETERPLIKARFDGTDVYFCPPCMPSLIHGLTSQELLELLRGSAASLD